MTVSVERYEENTGRLRSSRIAALQSSESAESSKFDSKTIMQEKRNALPTSETKYSDDESDDIEIIEPSAFRKRGLQFMYFLITLLRIIVMPTVLLFLIFACTKKQCTVLEVPQFFSRWKDFGNIMKIPFASVIVFHTFQCLLSLIPLGKKVTGFPDTNKSTLEYRLNGILGLICTVVMFSVCSYLGLYMNWGYDKYKTIALSSAIYCLLCSLVLHIASLVKGNGTVTSKVPLLGKFYNGSYTNPLLFGKVDVKTSFIRVGLIGSVVLNLSILLKFFLMKGYLTVPLVMTAGMQIFFVFDLFIREEKMLSTATYTSDSIGYAFMMTSGFLIPMGLALQNIFLFNNDAKAALVPHYCSALIACIFFGGYYIYLTSGNLKHNFRRNPFSPSLSDVASIPTSKKKRLIASGWWGKVRHPNYLGLLIMAIAWTLPCGVSHFVPYGPLIMLFIALVIRIFRVEAECKDKYGPAWSNYTEKVSSRLIPYIF